MKKKYLIIVGVLIVSLALILIFINVIKDRSTPSMKDLETTPSPILSIPTDISRSPTTDTDGYVNSAGELYTGDGGLGFTDDEIAQYDQESKLINASPYFGNGFEIIYNYDTYQFDVYFSDPQETSRQVFDAFIAENYPSIPKEKFIFILLNQNP